MNKNIPHAASHILAPVYLKANKLMIVIFTLLFMATLAMAAIHGRWVSALLIGSSALFIPLAAI